jgi:hypothetical protein
METLIIRKKSQYNWFHEPSDEGKFQLSRFYISQDEAASDIFRIVEFSGARRNGYNVGDITLIDETTGTTTTNFSTMEQLSLLLTSLNYPAFEYNLAPSTPFNLRVGQNNINAFANIAKILFEGGTVTEISPGEVLVTFAGGGGGSTLQQVFEVGSIVEQTAPNGDVLYYQAPFYDDGFGAIIEYLLIGNDNVVEIKRTERQFTSDGFSLYNYYTDKSSPIIKEVLFESNLGVFSLREIIANTDTNEIGFHRIQFDPIVGRQATFKTNPDKETGTYIIATLDDISASGVTDLAYVEADRQVTNSNGTGFTIPLSTNAINGVTKLYDALGQEIDGAITPKAVEDALLLKSNIATTTRNFVSDKALGATTAGGGSSIWTEIYKKLIPANTINDLDELAVEGICEALTNVATKSIGILVNSTDNIATAIEIGSTGGWVVGATRLNLRRELILRGTDLRGITTANPGTTDEAINILQTAPNQFLNYAFDPTIDNYVFFAVKGNLSDNFRKTLFEIKITPNLV